MDKQEAVHAAALATLAHGGPDCLTDPHIGLRLIGHALDLGATHDDIAAEMRRIRGEQQ